MASVQSTTYASALANECSVFFCRVVLAKERESVSFTANRKGSRTLMHFLLCSDNVRVHEAFDMLCSPCSLLDAPSPLVTWFAATIKL